MEKVIKNLNELRKTKITLYLLMGISFLIVFVITNFLHYENWLSYLIIFDLTILIVILYIVIEVKVANKYDDLYYNKFIPLLIKQIDNNYSYQHLSKKVLFNQFHKHIYNFDCNNEVESIITINKNDEKICLYDSHITINTFRSNKILLFKGYIFVKKNNIYNNADILISNDKSVQSTKLKFFKEFNNYKLYYNKDINLNKDLLCKLEKFLANRKKLKIIIGPEIIVFNKYFRSIFTKPIFRKINQDFINYKIEKLRNIKEFIDSFIDCFS